GAEIENDLAFLELCYRRRVAAAEACQCSRLGQLPALLCVVQRLAEVVRRSALAALVSAAAVAPFAVGAAGRAAAAGSALVCCPCCLCVPLAYFLAQDVRLRAHT